MNPLLQIFDKYSTSFDSAESKAQFRRLFSELEKALLVAESNYSREDGDELPGILSTEVAVKFLRDAAEIDRPLPAPIFNVSVTGLITLVWKKSGSRLEIIISKNKAQIIGSRSCEFRLASLVEELPEAESKIKDNLRELAVA